MKRIILTGAVAVSAVAFCLNSFAGAPKPVKAAKYAANDTIPKKDTAKKDTTHAIQLYK